MDWPTLLRRIQHGEDEHTEFKRELELKKVGKAMAAFANSDGGLVILGVDDDGTIVGVRGAAEAVSEKLTSFLQNGLSAPLQARIGRHESPHGWVHWLEVPRQRGFEPYRHGGVVYVRRARSSVEPGGPELADLYNTFGDIVTEERMIDGAPVGHVDIQAFAAYLHRLGLSLDAEPKVDLVDDLRARGVVAGSGVEVRATVYGVLSFGKTPQSYAQTQNFWIQCVEYGGVDRAAPVIQVADGKGRLDEQVDRALGWLAGLRRGEVYQGTTRIDVPILPVTAAREVLVNAVAHRDYAIMGSKVLVERFTDRLEVTSPGRLPNGITLASVTRGGNPRTRNQSMTNYLLAMGKMEQRGRGWPIIHGAMQELNGTTPCIEEDRDARWVRVTLKTAPSPGVG